MSELQVKESGKPKGNTVPVDDEKPPTYLPEIPHQVDLSKSIGDHDMVDVGKRHMFALLQQSAQVGNMNLRANMRLHLEIASAVVSAGQAGIKLAQEAETGGAVADGAALLTNIFMNIKGSHDNPLVSKGGATPPQNLDIGETPEDFQIKPGETDRGTQEIDPKDFAEEMKQTVV